MAINKAINKVIDKVIDINLDCKLVPGIHQDHCIGCKELGQTQMFDLPADTDSHHSLDLMEHLQGTVNTLQGQGFRF